MRNKRIFSNYINKLSVFGTVALLASASVLSGCSSEEKIEATNRESATEPDTNVIYIVLDDTGFSDLGSYGSEIKTPIMDGLAENGLRYNNAHVTPLCSPTRASLLTGRNSHEVGVGTVTNFDMGPEFPNKRGAIKPEAGTIAEVLKENDYNTYAAGKWHLAPTDQTTPAGPYDNWPLQKGFDQYYGFIEDSSDQYRPDLTIDNTQIPSPNDEEYHFSEAIIENSNRYITNHTSIHPDENFFLYLTFGAQHSPHQVPEKYIDMYEGVYDKGWDEVREERFEKQKELGIIPEDTKLSPGNEDIKNWDELTEVEKKNYIRFQETYAGFLTHTDEQIGKLVDNLRSLDQLDDTMIVLISDNGASGGGGANGSSSRTLAFNGEGETIEEVDKHYANFGNDQTGMDYPRGWAQVSNTPFRSYKNTAFEGGTHSPLIIHHPKLIKDPGSIRSQYVNVNDITPTVFDITGITPPEEINGVKQMGYSGESFKETLTNPKAKGREIQYFEVSGQRAIYHDGWKAVANHTKGEAFEEDQWSLYNVEEDFSETVDIAKENTDKLEELQKLWLEEAENYGALPLTDIFIEGFLSIPDDTLRAKNHYTYYRGMSRLTDSAAAPIINRSYEINIPIERNNSEEDGVLLAHGGIEAGYTIYIKNNKLVYEYILGGREYKITSNIDVPVGESVVTYKFDKTGSHEGKGTLYIDDKKVGETNLEETQSYKMSFEGLDVGKDSAYPVSQEYADQGEFEFKGKLLKVEYKLGNDEEFITPKS
ncbi:arylsulfatase [Planococcus sp. N064]|uniref:Arylsulfatase n=1 Tax=Planococcus liqunii TaxID=3058394 RepID=A0ABT8MRH6_9BACL|nr:arylsulfatase [Planococcus sp. N064]MDN7227336.1 arylsulfatase [Planococcus sp. N064]